MQTEAIRAFVAICDLGSFQAAAGALHLSQPAISKRLANLEDRLGHALFDRIGRGVALTEAGRAYLPHARELLAVVQDGERALENLKVEVAGRLRLALSHHVGLHRMPAILGEYVARFPAVDPDIVFMDSEAACRSVLNGEREIAVITLPDPPQPLLIEDAIWIDPMRVFVGHAHPLASPQIIEPADLANYPAVLPPTESHTYALITDALGALDVAITPRMTSHYLETLGMLAGAGMGWTVLPSSMRHEALVALDIEGLAMSRRLGAIRHPQRSLSNAAGALLAMLEQVRESAAS